MIQSITMLIWGIFGIVAAITMPLKNEYQPNLLKNIG
jgi:hypothetical protein